MILIITVPLIGGVTWTLNVVPLPLDGVTVTFAVVAPAVPLTVTSPATKPKIASLNVTVKLIGETVVGSFCPAACVI